MTIKRLFTSCFGLGWMPVAPGTWGSLPPIVVFVILNYFGASTALMLIVMASLVLFGGVVCVKFADAVIIATGKNDPREIVADELAGQAMALSFAALTPNVPTLTAVAIAFLLFRFFDIFKPWPIRKLEKLPKGWGILADDLLAGLYAGVILLISLRLSCSWCIG